MLIEKKESSSNENFYANFTKNGQKYIDGD